MQRSFFLKATAVAVALLAAAALGASPKAETPAQTAPTYGPGFGGGMMGRGYGPGYAPDDSTGQTWQGMGPGMMRGGRGRTAPGAQGGFQGGPQRGWQGQNVPALGSPLTLDGAAERVTAAIAEWGYTDLAVDEVIQYQWNFYVLVKEKSTGKGAVELLVDARTGVVNFEPGPNMMWNTKYGHMRWSGATTQAAISADEAKKIAADWLKQNGDTTTWGMDVNEMYGYYTIHLERDGRMEAMLSVNSTTKQVWYHSWHGPFVAAKEM